MPYVLNSDERTGIREVLQSMLPMLKVVGGVGIQATVADQVLKERIEDIIQTVNANLPLNEEQAVTVRVLIDIACDRLKPPPDIYALFQQLKSKLLPVS